MPTKLVKQRYKLRIALAKSRGGFHGSLFMYGERDDKAGINRSIKRMHLYIRGCCKRISFVKC